LRLACVPEAEEREPPERRHRPRAERLVALVADVVEEEPEARQGLGERGGGVLVEVDHLLERRGGPPALLGGVQCRPPPGSEEIGRVLPARPFCPLRQHPGRARARQGRLRRPLRGCALDSPCARPGSAGYVSKWASRIVPCLCQACSVTRAQLVTTDPASAG